MNGSLLALAISLELIFHFVALYLIYTYSLWDLEQASVNSVPKSFDIEEQPSLGEGEDDDTAIISEKTLSNHQSACFRAICVWLVAASIVTDWIILLILGLGLLLYERYYSTTKKRPRLPDLQLRVYIFAMLALIALLVTTLAMLLWSCRVFNDEAVNRYRRVAMIGGICCIILGALVSSACLSGHGPSSQVFLEEDADDSSTNNKGNHFTALG